MTIAKIKSVRLAFPALWTPEQYQGQGPFKYRANFLLSPNSEDKKELDAIIEQVALDKWGAKAKAILTGIRADRRMCCLWDGNLKPEWNGFEGNFCLTATRDQDDGAPIVCDRNAAALTSKDGKPYAGCYVNATVEIWAQDNGHGKAIRAQLRTVQFVKDGDSFGGGTRPSIDEVEDLSNQGDEAETPLA